MTDAKPVVTVCGLGPGAEDLLTEQTVRILSESDRLFLRTSRHPTAHRAVGAESFDEVYEQSDSFPDVYRAITVRLAEAARTEGRVTYCVPGSPLVLERSVHQLRARSDIDVELVPAISFLDEVWQRLAVDPVDEGVRLIDGHRFATEAAGERGPLLVAHAHAQWVLSDIKLAVEDPGDLTVVVLQGLGTADENVFEVPWQDLDRTVEADHLTTLYLPAMNAPVASTLAGTVELMRRLRADCPWDRQQDHASLRKHLLEESYEVLEVLDRLAVVASDTSSEGAGSAAGDGGGALEVTADDDELEAYEELEAELGDLWFQILFHTQLAAEAGHFTIADVAQGLIDKMVARHPHVFGVDEPSLHTAASEDGYREGQWEEIKASQTKRASAMDGIPLNLPALALASKVLKRAVGVVGPPQLSDAADRLADGVEDDSALGSLLLAAAEIARRNQLDPETALRQATNRLALLIRATEAGAESSGTQQNAPTAGSWVLG